MPSLSCGTWHQSPCAQQPRTLHCTPAPWGVLCSLKLENPQFLLCCYCGGRWQCFARKDWRASWQQCVCTGDFVTKSKWKNSEEAHWGVDQARLSGLNPKETNPIHALAQLCPWREPGAHKGPLWGNALLVEMSSDILHLQVLVRHSCLFTLPPQSLAPLHPEGSAESSPGDTPLLVYSRVRPPLRPVRVTRVHVHALRLGGGSPALGEPTLWPPDGHLWPALPPSNPCSTNHDILGIEMKR